MSYEMSNLLKQMSFSLKFGHMEKNFGMKTPKFIRKDLMSNTPLLS